QQQPAHSSGIGAGLFDRATWKSRRCSVTVSTPPHTREADWHIAIRLPTRLCLHPAVIDDLLAQLSKLPARCDSCLHMIRKQVHVRFNCDGFAVGALEVRRHATHHHKERMEPN